MANGSRHEHSSFAPSDSRPRCRDLAGRVEPSTPSAFDVSVGPGRRAGAARVAWRRHPVVMLVRGRVGRRPPVPAREPTTSRAVLLRRLRELPAGLWSYAWEDDEVRHLGPMAQDFWHTFGLGDSDRRIDLGDAVGVCMAAICALADRVDELDAELDRRPAATTSPETAP